MSESIRITHIGGPTALLEIGSLRLLTDPTLDAAGGAYPIRPKQHLTKIGEPALPSGGIEPLDGVLLSHDEHADNLDAHGRALLERAPIVLTTQSGAERIVANARGLAPWEHIVITAASGESVRVTAVPGRHGPPGSLALVGDVIGFVIESAALSSAVYVTGDTVWYEELPPIASRFEVGLVLVHLGYVRAPDGSGLTMSAADVPAVAQTFPRATLVPIHFEGWAHFTEGEAALRAATTGLHFLTPGIAHDVPLRSRVA